MALAQETASLSGTSDTPPHACKARIVIFTALFSEACAIARHLQIPAPSKNNLAQQGDLAIAVVGPAARLLPALPTFDAQGFLIAGLAGAARSSPENRRYCGRQRIHPISVPQTVSASISANCILPHTSLPHPLKRRPFSTAPEHWQSIWKPTTSAHLPSARRSFPRAASNL